MKKWILIAGLLLTGFAQAKSQLKFNQGSMRADLNWLTGPRVMEESILGIEWKKEGDLSPSDPPGLFRVELQMPLMKHGSVPTQIQRVLDPQGQPLAGVYEISNIYFSMGGDWDVEVSLVREDGSLETQILNVSLPKENGHHH